MLIASQYIKQINKINTIRNKQNLFYINSLKFKIKEVPSEQFVMITCYKMRNKLSILHKGELRELEKELEREVERDFPCLRMSII